MRYVRRKKYRNPVMIVVVILFIMVFFGFLYNKNRLNKEDIIKEVDEYIDDENISLDFLNWLNDKYGIKVLNSIANYLEVGKYDISMWHKMVGKSYIVLMDMYQDKYSKMDNVKVIDKTGTLTFSFVGDVSLADNFYIMPKYDSRNKGIYGILSREVVDIMTGSDLMVVNNEFTISDRGTKLPGKLYNFKASPKRVAIYDEMGVDLVTLANNHVYDFGEVAFNDTLDTLKENNIPYIGAGKNIDEAGRPFYFVINGYKFAFVNATRAEKNILTPEASTNSGGVYRCYNPSGFSEIIKNAKSDSDYVIALVHYGREDSHELEKEQVESSKIYIDSGADMVIGSHAHMLQGIEFYKDKPIFYNLGDFIFNNERKDTGILSVKINDDGNISYYFIPARQEDEYTELLHDNERIKVINDINKWSINATILEDSGQVTHK